VAFYPGDSLPRSTDSSVQQTGLLSQISIIVPVYNGAHIIGRLPTRSSSLTIPPVQYEILAIDNNSTDDLERTVAACSVKPGESGRHLPRVASFSQNVPNQ